MFLLQTQAVQADSAYTYYLHYILPLLFKKLTNGLRARLFDYLCHIDEPTFDPTSKVQVSEFECVVHLRLSQEFRKGMLNVLHHLPVHVDVVRPYVQVRGVIYTRWPDTDGS